MDIDDSSEEIILFPLTDLDSTYSLDPIVNGACNRNEDEENKENNLLYEEEGPRRLPSSKNNNQRKPTVTLRQRRHSKLMGQPVPNLNLQIKAKSEPINVPQQVQMPMKPARRNWMRALRKIRSIEDPWEKFNIVNLPSEWATRHRYHALKGKWVVDQVQVKMENEPFNHGAMRSCFRLKKLSTFSKSNDWKSAMNYVAKRYMEVVEREVYFEDVKLQMDAKLWGEEYNRHNPPKKVDVFQMSILEFHDRPEKPLYHLEHFIEGDYIKYNSNSGFVDESIRLTPQAFSHFTFERSGHRMIVVDIQGVGDLWTDPQIHTEDGADYGDGNLGTRGMALFFHSHMCNSICNSLNLSKFDLSPNELNNIDKYRSLQKNAETVVRGTEEMCVSASPTDKLDLHAFLAKRRHRSSLSSNGSHPDLEESPGSTPLSTPMSYDDNDHPLSKALNYDEEPMSPGSPLSPVMTPTKRRIRFDSECLDNSYPNTLTQEEERHKFQAALVHRASCVAMEMNFRNQLDTSRHYGISVLGLIHHDMAKYHELGRFAGEGLPEDMDAALFHEEQAAELGVMEAILTLARLYLGLQHDILVNLNVNDNEANMNKGLHYMEMAAGQGDRSAMIFMANAFESGIGLGTERTQSFTEAARWYQRAIDKTSEDECGGYDATMDNPAYQLKARLAEIYLSGGKGMEKDASYAGELYNEAADDAMGLGKGRLANKYYALAEEAWAQVEDPED